MNSFLNEPYFGSSWSEAAKGLRPREHSIAAGDVLYRFADSRRALAEAADGPWWFEYEHFQTIRHFALQHGYSLSYAARLFAAILYEWSEVDTVIRARTKGPLKVWKGAGKQIESGGRDSRDVTERMTPMQGYNSVLQLYVPGLGRPHRKFPELMSVLEVQKIATADSF